MAATHITEAEAAANFPALIKRVRAGEQIIIDSGNEPVAVIQSPAFPRRTIAESLALAQARKAELGESPVMDEIFAADMREIIANRKPRTSAWD